MAQPQDGGMDTGMDTGAGAGAIRGFGAQATRGFGASAPGFRFTKASPTSSAAARSFGATGRDRCRDQGYEEEEEAAAGGKIRAPKGWEVKYSQSKEPGRPYYVRISDGHRQWDPPNGFNWEVTAAIVIFAAVGLYQERSDPVRFLKETAVLIVVAIVVIGVVVGLVLRTTNSGLHTHPPVLRGGQQTGFAPFRATRPMERANAPMRAGAAPEGASPELGSTAVCAEDLAHDFSCDEKASVGRH